MAKWPWSKKDNPIHMEKKSAPVFTGGTSFVNFLRDGGNTDLSAKVALELYATTAPLADGIDRIAQEIASIPARVFDKKTKEFVDHPVLELLSHPNADSTYSELMTRYSVFLMLSGDSYLTATGQITNEPLELFVENPSEVEPKQSSVDGLVDSYRMNGKRSGDFQRTEDADGMRFVESNGMREIWQTKTFNPKPDSVNGLSVLSPIFKEIEQYNASGTHNLSLLMRGGRPSGMLSASNKDNEPLDDEIRCQLSSGQDFVGLSLWPRRFYRCG